MGGEQANAHHGPPPPPPRAPPRRGAPPSAPPRRRRGGGSPAPRARAQATSANVERFGPSVLLDRDERVVGPARDAGNGRAGRRDPSDRRLRRARLRGAGGAAAAVHARAPPPQPDLHGDAREPRAADAAGNITVLVTGTSFDDFGDVSCRFGVAAVPAHLHHHGALTCIVPPLSAAIPTTEHYPTHLSTQPAVARAAHHHAQRRRLQPSLPRVYYFNTSRVSVAALHPSGGPAAGGTLVNVSGANFVDHSGGVASSGPKCKFGRVVVPATILSLDQARCRAPPRRRAPASACTCGSRSTATPTRAASPPARRR